MEIDVSIIVPVYNACLYLRECIESLISQSHKKIELIFVDDGSTDNSYSILEEYKKIDERIKIFQQSNMNAGVARNNGLVHASGKYVMFLDSDDIFDLKMVKTAFEAAEKNNADFVIFDYYKFDHQTREVLFEPKIDFPNKVFTPDEVGDKIFGSYMAIPWNKIYLRAFVEKHGLRFDNVKKCNDTYFTFMSAGLAERIYYLPQRLLFYRINNSSSLQGSKQNFEAYVDCNMAVKKGLSAYGMYEGSKKRSLALYVCKSIHFVIDKISGPDDLQAFYNYVKDCVDSQLYDDLDNSPNLEILRVIHEEEYEQFLFYLLERERSRLKIFQGNSIMKTSTEYRYGKIINMVYSELRKIVKTILFHKKIKRK